MEQESMVFMEKLRPNDQRAKNAITLIWAVLIMEVISLISDYLQYDLLQTVSKGGEISIEAANLNDLREQIIGMFYLIILIISAVTFIQWFRRAYYNLHLKINYLSYDEGWAAGSWFVPFINLFRPYQIMKEIYKETEGLLVRKGIDYHQKLQTNVLGIWWALWLISGTLGQFVFRYANRAETVDELIISTKISMVSDLVGIPLTLIAIKIIKNYASVEPVLRDTFNQEETATANLTDADPNILNP